MAPIFLLGLLALVAALCTWFGDRFRIPAAPLLLLAGSTLGHWLHLTLTWEQIFPLLGVTVCLSFFEGGLVMGSRQIELAGLSKKLVAIGPKLGWVLITGVAGLVLGLPGALCLLLGAILMIFSSQSVVPLVSRLGGPRDVEELIAGECYLVSCLGAAWTALMVLVINAHATHPGVLQTLVSTTRLFLLGALIGYLGARSLAWVLHTGGLSDTVREPVCLAWILFCYGTAHAVLPGAGLVASTILGKTLSQSKVELPRPFYTSLQVCLVGLLGVLMGLLIPFSDLLRQPMSQIGFALLILMIRPVLVMAATVKQKLTPAQKRSLWAVSPRGVVTLGVAATAAELLGHEAMPQTLILPVLTYWVVLTTNLVPWLLSFLAKSEPTPS